MACGSGESTPGTTGSTPKTPPVSAKVPTADTAKPAAARQAPVAEAKQADTTANAAVAQSCLDLVASGDFKGAVPVCLEAASIDPKNAEVQAALAKAQSETAAKAASGAATDSAAKALGGIGD
jgi:Flp pilus assembly protein TadD